MITIKGLMNRYSKILSFAFDIPSSIGVILNLVEEYDQLLITVKESPKNS